MAPTKPRTKTQKTALQQHVRSGPAPETESAERPRVVLSEDGTLCYANAAFQDYFPANARSLEGQDALSLISILAGDNQEQKPADAASKALKDLPPGEYDLALPGFNMVKPYQFDWIEQSDGARLLVASELAESDFDDNKSRTKSRETIAGDLPEWLERAMHDQETRPFNRMGRDIQDENLKTAQPIEAKKADQAPQENDPWQFLNLSGDIMVILHENGDLNRVNKSFNKLLGVPDKELFEMSLFSFIHEDDRSEAKHSFQALVHEDGGSGSEPIEFEIRMQDSHYKTLWVKWRMALHGGMVYGVGHDCTAKKEHERALEKREAELSEAQEIGRMGHWHWTVGSSEIEWSRQIYKIFGVDEDAFHPTLDNVNALLHAKDVGRLLQAFQRAIIEQNTYDMDFRVNRADGEVRHVRCEGRCEIDEQGEVVALFGIMQDITERVNNEKVLRESKEAAERAYAAKSQFLANMSHELRTPLNAIIGFSEMMQRQLLGPIGTEKYLDYITGIRESGEHLLDLISDILDMSKMEAGKYTLDLEQLNLSKTIRLAIHMMEGRAVDSGIKLSADIPNEDLVITADRRALMQILLNIISNAVKFTDDGGQVNIIIREREQYVSIKVHDTGIGIPPNKLSNIVRPFEQVSSHYSRDHQGSGLGLAITKELVELHHGTLLIDSELDKGTTVTVHIPYQIQTDDSQSGTKKKEPETAPSGGRS